MAPKYKKAKSVQERRSIRRMQELQKAQDQDDEIDEIEEDVDEVEEDAADDLKKQLEEIEKDMGMDMQMPIQMEMPTGPTSFEELDAAEAAQEQVDEIMEASCDVRQLVNNILNHPMMDVKEKAAAIQSVGSGLEQRITDIMSGAEDTQKDLDLLSVESVIAYDKRNTGVISQWIDKAVLSTSARKKLTPEQFALPSKKKYPIHDKAHVRNALARAVQEMKAGGASAADAKAALPAIHAAAKRMGIGMSMKKERNAVVIEKDSAGDWRWVGWVSNNFIDNSHDIITESAHLEYVDWVNKDMAGRAPVFTSCHAPGTYRENPVDFVGYENGFLVMSGKLNESEARALITVSKEVDIGMSHTSFALRDPNDVRQIMKYRCFEVTDLPVDCADNSFTTFETLSKEADMDSKSQLDYLSALLGSKEKAEQALKIKTSLARKELSDAGVESKEATATPVPDPVTPDPVTVPVAVDETVVKELMTRLTKDLDIQGLNEFVTKAQEAMEKVPLLETALKELQGLEDEHLAAKISPPATTFAWSHRASESKETIVKEGEKVGDEPTPGEFWLSDATGTAPVPSSK